MRLRRAEKLAISPQILQHAGPMNAHAVKSPTRSTLIRPKSVWSGNALPLLLGIVCLSLSTSVLSQQSAGTIESGEYQTDSEARAAWRPMAGTAPVSTAILDGKAVLRFPCNFEGTQIERASWDHQVRLDLADYNGVQFDFFCQDASPVSHFSLYFQSGEGWYSATFYPETSGWNQITIDISAMSTEGKPGGFASIRTIRISAWRGSDKSTEFYLHGFRAVGGFGPNTHVGILRCDSAARTRSSDAASVQQYCTALAEQFKAAGIEYATVSDLDLTSGKLHRLKLIVLPYNPVMPENTTAVLVEFIKGGGRLLSFFGMPETLRPCVKIEVGSVVRPAKQGGFARIRFVEGVVPGAPLLVGQNSWNILELKPVPGASREVAEWLDDRGQPTGHAAIVASANAVAVSHVLLTDDISNKRQMLLALTGYLVPQVWQQAADVSLSRLGRLAGYMDFENAVAAIAKLAGENQRVEPHLAAGRKLRDEAIAHRAAGRYSDAWARAQEAADRLLTAYACAQGPIEGEFRAFWCHSAFGVEGMDWDTAIRLLAKNGFTAILPNLLWGGLAFYPSAVLPVSPEVLTRGDQLEQCLAACRKYGLQIHVWKVNWNLGSAPREFVERLRAQGRLQSNAAGETNQWLCPSHPENQKLEIDSMIEVVRRYPVDGIHFDYIRYPDGDHCYCAGCRQRFMRHIGVSALRWPQDVQAGGPHRQAWLDWRRANISTVVHAISEKARTVRPTVKISAAVFPNWPSARDNIGQDWKVWCERGWLDFVCPMNYTTSNVQFQNLVRSQRSWAGAVPCYPGIGAWVMTPDRVIGQIDITRRCGTGGFVVFNYDSRAVRDILPMLGKGITRPKKSGTPED